MASHCRGAQRAGGFGGAAGLERFLRDEPDRWRRRRDPSVRRADLGKRASRLRRGGCARGSSSPRPPWQQQPGDEWIEVADAAAAAARLPGLGRRAFLTVGAADLAAFASLSGVWCLVRLVDEPARSVPLTDYRLIVRRGPFDEAGERALFADNRIDVLVTKASGGAATAAKLTAAREAGRPVVMLRRPPAEPGERVATVDAAADWAAARLALP